MRRELHARARPYQIEIFERAARENVIAYIPTGAGKTFISVLLIHELVYHRAMSPPSPSSLRPRSSSSSSAEVVAARRRHRMVFFLVNTVPLVVQQAKVIRGHTALSVGEYFGERTLDTAKKDVWDREFAAHDVLVMTAAIFLHLLTHGFVRMRDIALLIFDECHHARKDHPYNQIMRDFYHAPDPDDAGADVIYGGTTADMATSPGAQRPGRPKIFGMTASPVHINPIQGALGDSSWACEMELRKLERRMDCRVCTSADPNAVYKHIVKPEERLLHYDPPAPLPPQVGWASVIEQLDFMIASKYGSKRLWKQTRRHTPGPSSEPPSEFSLVEHLRAIQSTLVQLGPLCTLYFVEEMLGKREARSMQRGREHDAVVTNFIRRECVGHLQFVLEAKLMDMITPKIRALLNKLRECRNKPEFRGIVFVDRRPTAKALSSMLHALNRSQPEFDFLKCHFLVGHGTGAKFRSGDDMGHKEQTKVIEAFRRGVVNLLIATSVAEEGLDIQPCNLVIRFSPIQTTTQYIQSRGRARHEKAEYVVMAMRGDHGQQRSMDWAHESEAQTNAACSRRAESAGIASTGTVIDNDDKETEEALQEMLTGAKLTAPQSVGLIHHYCATLGDELPTFSFERVYGDQLPAVSNSDNIEADDDNDDDDDNDEEDDDYYECIDGVDPDSADAWFVCTLRMPLNSLVQEIRGSPRRSKKAAKRRAALVACRELHRLGALNHWLLPARENDSEMKPGEEMSNLQQSRIVSPRGEQHNMVRALPVSVPKALRGQWPLDLSQPIRMHLYTIQQSGVSMRYGFVTPAEEVCRTCPPFVIYPREPLVATLRKRYAGDSTAETMATGQSPEEMRVTLSEIIVLEPEQALLAWKFHLAFSSVILPTRPALVDLDAWTRVACGITAPTALPGKEPGNSSASGLGVSVDRSDKMYLVLPLRDASSLPSARTGDADARSSRVDWEFMRRVVCLAEHQIAIKAKPHEDTTNETTPLALDVRRPTSRKDGLSSFPLTTTTPAAIEEPVALYLSYAPGRYFLLFRPRPDLTPASYFIGTRMRNVADNPSVTNIVESTTKELTFADHYRNKYGLGVSLDQPLMEVCYLTHAKNLLRPSEESAQASTAAGKKPVRETTLFLVPELCRVHPIGGQWLTDALSLPSILWKTEAMFLVDEFVRNADILIENEEDLKWIVNAFTAPCCDEPDNYEVLETLGDSFLKLAVSAHLYMKNPNAAEGQLSAERSTIVSNQNLCKIALTKQLERYLAVSPFTLSRFQLPGVPSEASEAAWRREVSENVLSDCVEALIGALFVIGQTATALHGMRWLGFDVSGLALLDRWRPMRDNDEEEEVEEPSITNGRTTSFSSEVFGQVEAKLNYRFRDRVLLQEALTHMSYLMGTTRSYQRLEFLGDAVLDFLIMRHIYNRLLATDASRITPALLSDMRRQMTNNEAFARITVEHGFHNFLAQTSSSLFHSINRYAGAQLDDASPRKKAKSGAKEARAPKVLGDIFEALAGAVFVDCGGDMELSWRVLQPFLARHLAQLPLPAASSSQRP